MVKDVGAIEDGAAAQLRLCFQEGKDALARKDIEVRRDLIHQVYWPVRRQDFQELAAAALTIGDAIDLPVDVNLKHIGEVLAPGCLALLSEQIGDGSIHEELGIPPISAIHHVPSDRRIVEAILSKDLREASGNHSLSTKD